MLTFLSVLPSKVKTLLATAGAIIVAVAIAFLKGRKSGKLDMQADITKETHKVEKQFQKIDAGPADFDGAIGSLRKRSLKP